MSKKPLKSLINNYVDDDNIGFDYELAARLLGQIDHQIGIELRNHIIDLIGNPIANQLRIELIDQLRENLFDFTPLLG
jgi:hypothetical protein